MHSYKYLYIKYSLNKEVIIFNISPFEPDGLITDFF